MSSLSLAVGPGETVLGVDPCQHAAEALQRGLCARAVHPCEGDEEGLALHQRNDGGAVVAALEGVALPVARHQPFGDLCGAFVDVQHVGDLASAVLPADAGTALGVTEAQQRDDLGALLASGHGVDGLVDGLVREAEVGVLRVRALGRTRRLLVSQAYGELLQHRSPGYRAVDQVALHTRLTGQPHGPLMVWITPNCEATSRDMLQLWLSRRGRRDREWQGFGRPWSCSLHA